MRELIDRVLQALQAEITASTSGRGSERSLRILEGQFQRSADQRHIYVFKVPRSVPRNYDDAPVKLLVSGREVTGSIVGLTEFEAIIALDEYLGTFIAEGELKIDLSFILKRLAEVLQDRSQAIEKHPISRKAMGFAESPVYERQPAIQDSKLNQTQLRALRKCIGSDF